MSRSHKYISKVRTKSGKWRYIYKDVGSGAPTPTIDITGEAYRRANNAQVAKNAYHIAKDVYNSWSSWSDNNRRQVQKFVKDKVVPYFKEKVGQAGQAVKQQSKNAKNFVKELVQNERRNRSRRQNQNGPTQSATRAYGSSRPRQRSNSGRSATVRGRRKSLPTPIRR